MVPKNVPLQAPDYPRPWLCFIDSPSGLGRGAVGFHAYWPSPWILKIGSSAFSQTLKNTPLETWSQTDSFSIAFFHSPHFHCLQTFPISSDNMDQKEYPPHDRGYYPPQPPPQAYDGYGPPPPQGYYPPQGYPQRNPPNPSGPGRSIWPTLAKEIT